MDGSFKCSSSAIFSVMHATRPYSTVHSRYAASQIETGCGLRRQRILAAQVFLAYGARLAGALRSAVVQQSRSSRQLRASLR